MTFLAGLQQFFPEDSLEIRLYRLMRGIVLIETLPFIYSISSLWTLYFSTFMTITNHEDEDESNVITKVGIPFYYFSHNFFSWSIRNNQSSLLLILRKFSNQNTEGIVHSTRQNFILKHRTIQMTIFSLSFLNLKKM